MQENTMLLPGMGKDCYFTGEKPLKTTNSIIFLFHWTQERATCPFNVQFATLAVPSCPLPYRLQPAAAEPSPAAASSGSSCAGRCRSPSWQTPCRSRWSWPGRNTCKHVNTGTARQTSTEVWSAEVKSVAAAYVQKSLQSPIKDIADQPAAVCVCARGILFQLRN